MNPRDILESWKEERRGAGVPDGFADRVMVALHREQALVRADHPPPIRPRTSRVVSVLAWAAVAGIAAAYQAAFVGAFLFVWPGTAR
jgi:hypothetical protein